MLIKYKMNIYRKKKLITILRTIQLENIFIIDRMIGMCVLYRCISYMVAILVYGISNTISNTSISRNSNENDHGN